MISIPGSFPADTRESWGQGGYLDRHISTSSDRNGNYDKRFVRTWREKDAIVSKEYHIINGVEQPGMAYVTKIDPVIDMEEVFPYMMARHHAAIDQKSNELRALMDGKAQEVISKLILEESDLAQKSNKQLLADNYELQTKLSEVKKQLNDVNRAMDDMLQAQVIAVTPVPEPEPKKAPERTYEQNYWDYVNAKNALEAAESMHNMLEKVTLTMEPKTDSSWVVDPVVIDFHRSRGFWSEYGEIAWQLAISAAFITLMVLLH